MHPAPLLARRSAVPSRRLGASAAMVIAAAVLAACSSTPLPPVQDAAPPVLKAADGGAMGAGGSTSGAAAGTAAGGAPAASQVTSVTLPAYLDPKNPIARDRSVYFGYDEYSVPTSYTAMLEGHGRFLAANPSVAIRVEGNTDERGSPEYNLALGQKRAEAVVRVLSIYGVRANQMEAVSWGEERPQAAGHDEAAWAKNRRVDLGYPSK